MKVFRMVGFVLTSLNKGQARISSSIKAEERTKKWRARATLILNRDIQPQNTQWTKVWPCLRIRRLVFQPLAWRVLLMRAHTAWMAAVPLNLANHPTHVVLDLGCTRAIGSRPAIERFQKHASYYGITTECCRFNKSFVFARSETETCWKSCSIHFPTTRPYSTRVDVLETDHVVILFSLPQMKNWVWQLSLTQKDTTLHVQLLARLFVWISLGPKTPNQTSQHQWTLR